MSVREPREGDLEELTREQLVAELSRLMRVHDALQVRHDEAAQRARLVHELELHQIELEMQNRELSAAYESLAASRRQFARLYELAPVAYLTLDAHGTIVAANVAAAALLGHEPGALVGRPLVSSARFRDPAALAAHLRRTGLEGRASGELELERDARVVRLHAVSVREVTEQGVRFAQTALVDVGEQRRAEDALAAAYRREQGLRERLELLAGAQLAITEALAGGLDDTLAAIVAHGRRLAGADFALLGLAATPGAPFERVMQHGIVCEDAPLLLHRLGGGEIVRLADVADDPRFAGLPPSLPPVASVLSVPVRHRAHVLGVLMLVNARGAPAFDGDDERFAVLLAERAGLAIAAARVSAHDARQRAFLQAIVDQIPEGILVSDARGQVVTMNARARELSVADPDREAGAGHPVMFDVRLPTGEASPWLELPLVHGLAHGAVVSDLELTVATREGRLVPILASTAPMIDERGVRVGAVAAWRDITALKRHERALEDARTTAEAATDLLVHLAHSSTQLGNLDAIPGFLAAAAIDHLGADASAVLVTHVQGGLAVAAARNAPGLAGFRAEVGLVGAALVDAVASACGAALPYGRALPIARGDDLFGVLVLLFARAHEPSPERHRLVGGLVDLAASAFADAQRERYLEAVRDTMMRTEKLRALGELAAGVSHDLRNVLAPLAMYADTLERSSAAGSRQIATLASMRRVLARAQTTLDRLRTFGRYEAMPAERLDLNELVRESVGMSEARRRDAVHIDLRLLLGAPPPIVAEPSELVTSVLNLLVNAFDALADRGGTVTVRTGEDAGGGWVEVEDDGPGISPALHARVFEPLFSTKGTAGTGIGLAMVSTFVHRQGGRVTLASELGAGARFRMWLPGAA